MDCFVQLTIDLNYVYLNSQGSGAIQVNVIILFYPWYKPIHFICLPFRARLKCTGRID